MATYPTENSIRTAPIARKATGIPTSPVIAKPVVTTPATTVIGVAAVAMKKTTAATPRRSVASERCGDEGGAIIPEDTITPARWRGTGVPARDQEGAAEAGQVRSERRGQHARGRVQVGEGSTVTTLADYAWWQSWRRWPVSHLPDGSERSEEHTSELQSRGHLVCRLLLEKKKKSY